MNVQNISVSLIHVIALAAIATLLALGKVDQTAGFGLIAAIVGLAAPSSVQSSTPTTKAVPVTFPTQAPTPIPAPPVPPVPPVTP